MVRPHPVTNDRVERARKLKEYSATGVEIERGVVDDVVRGGGVQIDAVCIVVVLAAASHHQLLR
eukprot:COSAG01_NODE_59275_length_301_cov_0.762376_1_plen_63_part_01